MSDTTTHPPAVDAPVDDTRPTFTVPEWVLPGVIERTDRLAKLATRLGVEAPAVLVLDRSIGIPDRYWLSDTEADRLRFGDTRGLARPLVTFAVTGTTPRLPGGWQLLATVEHTDAGNLVACSPVGRDRDLARSLADAAASCDHCGLTRQRRYTFVVADTNGAIVRVGRGCLTGFLGLAGMPEDALFRFLGEIDGAFDDDYGMRSTPPVPTFAEVAALAFAAVRRDGFVRTDAQYQSSTRDTVAAALRPRRPEERLDVTAADLDDATAAIAWLAEVDPDGDFLANLAVLARLNAVESRRLGLAVAVVPAWQRHLGTLVRDAQRDAERAERTPVVCGTAVTITGAVVKLDAQDTPYGTRYVMTVSDDRGFAVWGSQPSGLHLRIGDRVSFTAAVEASGSDPTFGFYKRPRKASVLGA